MLTLVATIGENIKRIREAKDLKQDGVAEKIGVAGSQLSAWEGDRYKSIGSVNLLKIARALKCSVDEIVAGVDVEYDAIRRDLPRHTEAAQSASVSGEDDRATTSTRVLTERAARQLADDVKAAIKQLGRVALALEKEAGAAAPEGTRRPRRHRRAG